MRAGEAEVYLVFNKPPRLNAMPTYHNVCRVDEIPEGEARMYVVKETPIGLFHVAGLYYALHNECPHAGASLAHGIIDNDVVSCRIHHWRFCIRDGSYLDEERPQLNVRSFPVRIVEQQVQVEI